MYKRDARRCKAMQGDARRWSDARRWKAMEGDGGGLGARLLLGLHLLEAFLVVMIIRAQVILKLHDLRVPRGRRG